MEWSPHLEHLEALADEAIEAGRPEEVPQALLDRPEVQEHLEWYLAAFWTLSPSRMLGFGPGGIMLAEMLAYSVIFGVSDRERFVRTMQALDHLYLETTVKAEPAKAE